MECYDDAVKDCNMSVKLKPDYPKAYSRLGAALVSLKKYRQAADNGYRLGGSAGCGGPQQVSAHTNAARAPPILPTQPSALQLQRGV